MPEEKKKLIREAAIKEFCRVPLEKVSINKIVQNADISRGSFYTYFRDKEDVLEYIFEDVVFQLQSFCEGVLDQSKGEFWELPTRLLDYTLEICETNKMFTLAQSRFGNQAISQMLDMKCKHGIDPDTPGRPDTKKAEENQNGAGQIRAWLRRLYHRTDCSRLSISSFNEFDAMFSLCMMNMMAAIGEIYQRGIDKKLVRQMFDRRLEIIRLGTVKR